MAEPLYLGISAFYHDSAAAIVAEDGSIVAAAHEERFTRVKHDKGFPVGAVAYALEEAGVEIPDLKAIAFYEKPYIKWERLLETFHAFAPGGLGSFLSAIPVWIREKLFARRMIWEGLEVVQGERIRARPKLLFPEHHLSHAASAFYPSPFERAAILTVDGVGEWATTTICHGEGNRISFLRELRFPHSLGLLYSAFTYYCGFKVNNGEYKLMGLAPYGRAGSERAERYRQLIVENLVDMREDGSLLLDLDYFAFHTGDRMCRDRAWERLFGLSRRREESEILEEYTDLAWAIQQVTTEVVMRLARTARELTGEPNLVMAGGVALNCVANGEVLRSGLFDDLWIQPAAGDAGGALGAALAAVHLWNGSPRRVVETGDRMQGSYLGPSFGAASLARMTRKRGAVGRTYNDFGELCRLIAERLDAGDVVGWFQGRMEWGPRALGNRSILGDPRNPEMQKRLNLKIKYRESFRPFAPSVQREHAADYFDMEGVSPYMLLVAPVGSAHRKAVPDNYAGLGMWDRLYYDRSSIPAVTHVDFSARVQTVDRDTNPRFWELIEAFRARTGCALLVNTSFNVRGEPIVCTPDDAYRCFMKTEMDWLVVNDCVFDKRDQSVRDGRGWGKESERA